MDEEKSWFHFRTGSYHLFSLDKHTERYIKDSFHRLFLCHSKIYFSFYLLVAFLFIIIIIILKIGEATVVRPSSKGRYYDAR